MSLAYHSTEYLENQIETFKILLGKKDVDIAGLRSLLDYTTDTHEYRKLRAENASLRAQNELTHAAYVEENNHLMVEREALRSELAAAKRELNDAEEARNDAETRLLALTAHQDAEEKARLREALENTTSILEDAQSGHIPGCGGDTEWLRSRDVVVKNARAALACHPQGEKS